VVEQGSQTRLDQRPGRTGSMSGPVLSMRRQKSRRECLPSSADPQRGHARSCDSRCCPRSSSRRSGI
jgi:hypothetical protein